MIIYLMNLQLYLLPILKAEVPTMMTTDTSQMLDKLHYLDCNTTVFYLLLKSGRRVFITYEGYRSNPRYTSEGADSGDREYYPKLNEVYRPSIMDDVEKVELSERLESYKSLEAFIAAVESGELKLVALDAPIPWAVAQT